MQRMVFPQFAIYFSVATAMALAPSATTNISVKIFSKVLSIQSSKAEPPRVAFDEVFKIESLSEWNLLKSNSGAQNLNEQKTMIAQNISYESLRAQKITLRPMTFSPVQAIEAQRVWIDTPTVQQQAEIKRNEPKAQKTAQDTTKETEENSKVLIEAMSTNGTKVSSRASLLSGVQIKKEGVPERTQNQAQTQTPYIVSGEIEYSGTEGLPAGPRWRIRVAHYDDDVKTEEAQVDKRNIYRIQVPQLSGSIFAQLVDQQTGDILGEGSYRLSSYVKDQINGRAKIIIHRSNNQVAARMGSFYHRPGELTGRFAQAPGSEKNISAQVLFASVDSEGKTDSDGHYRFDQVMKGSWGLLRTEAKDYYPAVFLVKSGEGKRLPLFPEKMINAMKQIMADQALSSQVAETGSIVWGRISQDGKPVAGAQVDVEFLEQFQPVYFNSLLIPDSSLKATSENGFFAFMHLPAGFHSLISSRGSAYLSHANVVVDDNAISIAEMESSMKTEKVDVKVFDAFVGTAQNADLELQSLGQQIHAQGFAQLDIQPISRLSFLRVHPQNQQYHEALQFYDDSSEFIHVPLISKAWLAKLMDTSRTNVVPDTGTIVGFATGFDFEVYLSHEKDYSAENILYFNAQGQRTESGVKGGGFILQNVPPGVQSVVLAAKNSSLLQTQVLPVDNSNLVVMKFR